jgi:type I restriction enzyme S subunit
MQGALLAGETGATAKHVNMKDIRRLVLRSLHDRDSQTRIAVAITGFDGLIENNRRRIKLLEEAARLIYREWFVHLRFPGHALAKVNNGLPEGWERVEIGNVSPFSYGKGVREHERIPGNVPVVSSSGRMATHNKALVQGPGLVIGRKGNVGTVHLILPDFWPTDTAFYVSGIADIGYLYHAFQSAGFVNTDVAVPGLNRDFAHSRKIVWPTKELRKQFSEMVMSHAAMQFTLERASAKLESARDLLLPRLMSGEIVV